MNNNIGENVRHLDFEKNVEKLFRGILSVKNTYPAKTRFISWEIETVYKLIKDSSLLDFDAALWLPMRGNIKSKGQLYSLDLRRINKCYTYNLGINFILTYRWILLRVRKDHGEDAYNMAKDILSDKLSNDLIATMRSRIVSCKIREKHIARLVAFLEGYKIKKGIMSVFMCHNGLNVAAFYRSSQSNDFIGEEHIFMKAIIPFLHVLISIKQIPWFSVINEWLNCKQIIYEEGEANNEFMSMFVSGISNLRNREQTNAYKFYARNPKGIEYVFFAVRLFDFRNNPSSTPLLAVAAFSADDFREDGKYYSIYGHTN